MDLVLGLLRLDQHLNAWISHHAVLSYCVLFIVIFCETGILPFFFFPGDSLLFFCGALCATNTLEVFVLWPVLVSAGVLGGQFNFSLGRWIIVRYGAAWFRHDRRWLDQQSLARSHVFYEKYGAWTFLISPFVAVVRTFSPFVAGMAQMSPRKFTYAMIAGVAIWVTVLLSLGFYLGNFPKIRSFISVIVIIGLLIGLGFLLLFKLRRIRNIISR